MLTTIHLHTQVYYDFDDEGGEDFQLQISRIHTMLSCVKPLKFNRKFYVLDGYVPLNFSMLTSPGDLLIFERELDLSSTCNTQNNVRKIIFNIAIKKSHIMHGVMIKISNFNSEKRGRKYMCGKFSLLEVVF